MPRINKKTKEIQRCFDCQHYLGHGDDQGATGTCLTHNSVRHQYDGSSCVSFDNNGDKDVK